MPRWGSACQWEQGVHTATLAYAHAASGDVERAAELGFAALELARLGPWAATPAMAELSAQLR